VLYAQLSLDNLLLAGSRNLCSLDCILRMAALAQPWWPDWVRRPAGSQGSAAAAARSPGARPHASPPPSHAVCAGARRRPPRAERRRAAPRHAASRHAPPRPGSHAPLPQIAIVAVVAENFQDPDSATRGNHLMRPSGGAI
jgi:hypothetical protein